MNDDGRRGVNITLTLNQRAVGSSPTAPTNENNGLTVYTHPLESYMHQQGTNTRGRVGVRRRARACGGSHARTRVSALARAAAPIITQPIEKIEITLRATGVRISRGRDLGLGRTRAVGRRAGVPVCSARAMRGGARGRLASVVRLRMATDRLAGAMRFTHGLSRSVLVPSVIRTPREQRPMRQFTRPMRV